MNLPAFLALPLLLLLRPLLVLDLLFIRQMDQWNLPPHSSGPEIRPGLQVPGVYWSEAKYAAETSPGSRHKGKSVLARASLSE